MTLKKIIILSFIALKVSAQTDFRFDSSVYKTMYPKDLCAYMKNHPDLLLIDARTPGEFSDTSMYGYLNIGHLKNAVNIPIDSISNSIGQIKHYQNKPIVIYCSHSQRSRRVSKTLTENGFTRVTNLNGGMSWMNQANEAEFPCKKEMIVSLSPYKNSSAAESVQLMKTIKDLVILDVRTREEFEGKDSIETLNIGRLKNAINIPERDLKNKLAQINAYKNKPILVYSIHGSESSMAATFLIKNGFTQVYHLMGGLSTLIATQNENVRTAIMTNTPSYKILNVKETVDLLTNGKELMVLDVRPKEEFTNTSKESWKNLGNIKRAVNISPPELPAKANGTSADKKIAILVYGGRNAAEYCKQLKKEGFEQVNLLYGGLWNMVSAYANISGLRNIKGLLENNAGLY